MDELDRMYRRLVQNIRAASPELLTRPFEASQIYQQIIPYRLNRRELGLESNEAYELTLLKLLAGVRELVIGDEDMQRALRTELDSSNPDLTAFRAYATSTVALNPEAVRAIDMEPMVRATSPGLAAAAARPGATTKADMASRATEEVDVSARRELEAKAPARASAAREPATAARTVPATAVAGCRYCGEELPEGREITYCPHCGQNLTIKHCPACSTELETGWRFCIACGRQVD